MGKKAVADCETRTVLKSSLTLPFGSGISWPMVEKIDNRRIIEEIKQELPKIINKRPSSKKKNAKGKRKINVPIKNKNLSKSDLLLVGINAVTKALEKGTILLVLVCKSARPVNMTHHLISLCAIRNTPGCCINKLSDSLSEILGLKSVLAVGFKERPDNPLQDLVDFIKDKIPPLIIPWVNIWRADPALKGNAWTKKEVCINNMNEGIIKGDDFAPKDVDDKIEEDISIQVDEAAAPKNETRDLEVLDEATAIVSPACDVETNHGSPELDTICQQNSPNTGEKETAISNTKYEKLKRAKKRNIEDVTYSLHDANFKFTEVNIKVKKKNKGK